MSGTFPRLLIATEFPPNASGGGPAVVRQMLEGWPAEKLSWWSVLPETDTRFGQNVARHHVATIPARLYPQITLPQVKARILDTAWVPFASRHLKKTLQRLQPDVVWAIPHQWSIPPLAKVLPGSIVPFHVSMHDFADAHHLAQRIGTHRTARLLASTHGLYRTAQSRDAISEEMAADLRENTGASPDQILHAGVEPDDFRYLENKTVRTSEAIMIAYAGTIIAEETFILFAESLARIRSHLPRPLELHLFGAHSYQSRHWFDREWMFEHGNLADPELKTAMRGFAWGFAPMELTNDNARYNRFSLPTKIVSYLAAGLGIIAIGHGASTVSRLGNRYSFGPALTELARGTIDAVLQNCLAELDVWSRYGSEILRCARSEFDAGSMRRILWQRLGAVT
ncbi:MAG: hypothetical protein H0W43_00195 [Chthoniobacterales bacterium]|nr:hypothetical protein [Chthoniobacterales bacterium]